MKSLFSSVLALVFIFSGGIALSQPVLSPENLAMGGGGTAYITGYEANFINPANLMIRERATDVTIGTASLGAFFTPVMPSGNLRGQLNDYRYYLDRYRPDGTDLTVDEKNAILERNYAKGRLQSEHQHRFDAILAGLQWQRKDHTFSFTARARTSTRVEVGRGWYDTKYVEARRNSSTFIRDMSLIQQSQYLYEFSMGYAQTFNFVSGLIPRLGKLFIGIAPKFIIAGSYMNLEYNSQYRFNENDGQPRLYQSFNYSSTGNFSDATRNYTATGNAGQAIRANFPSSFLNSYSDYTNPTGYGAGFDFGLVYVLSLGDDLSLAETTEDDVTNKSLRLGFSVTDLGFVSYDKNNLNMIQRQDTLQNSIAPTTSRQFEGSPGQYITFFDQTENAVNPLSPPLGSSSRKENTNGFTTILPTSFNAGMLLHVNRLKLSADLMLGLNESAFNNTKLTAHFGMEFMPIKPVPIRIGTQLATGHPTIWSTGTGVEMKNWEVSLGAHFLTPNNTNSPKFGGAAVGGLKFHF